MQSLCLLAHSVRQFCAAKSRSKIAAAGGNAAAERSSEPQARAELAPP